MGNCFSKSKYPRKANLKISDDKLQTSEIGYQKLLEVTEECNTLKLSLAAAEKQKELAQDEVKHLTVRVRSLVNVVRDLQESAESMGHVEKQHKFAQHQLQLQQKQLLLEQLQQINSNTESKHAETVLALNLFIYELEEKVRAEEKKREELTQEIRRLQKEAMEKERPLSESEDTAEVQVSIAQEVEIIQGQDENKEEICNEKIIPMNQSPPIKSQRSSCSSYGPIQVYIAKYNYDPFKLSPNENPEAELPLRAGDYVLVVGDVDEDGFYNGELIDGTQGLVPSNFIEKIQDEDLLDFHTALLQTSRKDNNLTQNSNLLNAPALTSTSTTENNNSNNSDIYFMNGEQPFKTTKTGDKLAYNLEELQSILTTQFSTKTGTDEQQRSLLSETIKDDMNIFTEPTYSETLRLSDADVKKDPDTDEEIEETFKDFENLLNMEDDILNESTSASRCTELSDIPEVEEDLIGSQDSCLNILGTDVTNQMSFNQDENRFQQMAGDGGYRSPLQGSLNSLGHRVDSGFLDADTSAQNEGSLFAESVNMVPHTKALENGVREQKTMTDNNSYNGNTSASNTPTDFYENKLSSEPSVFLDHHYSPKNINALQQADQSICIDDSGGPEDIDVLQKTDRTVLNESMNSSLLTDIDELSSETETIEDNAKCQNSMADTGTKSHKPLLSRSHSAHSVSKHKLTRKKHLTKFSSFEHCRNNSKETKLVSKNETPCVTINTVRLFIALFDYDPATMSPNLNSLSEELQFKEGQILKVFGDKDDDGFYKGENNGKLGYVPCNMVCEINVKDPDLMEQLLLEASNTPGQVYKAVTDHNNHVKQIPNGVVPNLGKGHLNRKMIALYDYDPQELSPNADAEMELRFRAGDVITVYGDMDEDGFYSGEINTQHGLVPSNYLRPVSLSVDLTAPISE